MFMHRQVIEEKRHRVGKRISTVEFHATLAGIPACVW